MSATVQCSSAKRGLRNGATCPAVPRRAPRVLAGSTSTLVLLIVSALWGLSGPAFGTRIRLDRVELIPPGTANRIELTVQAGPVLGQDSELADVTGRFALDMEIHPVSLAVSELTIVDGQVAVSDTRFRLLAGFLTLTAQDIVGQPSTIVPPGAVQGTQFDAAQHQISFNTGTLNFAGDVYDLADDPIIATPTGTGTVQLREILTPPNTVRRIEVEFRVPVTSAEDFDFTIEPTGNEVTARLLLDGELVGRGVFDFPLTLPTCDTDDDLDVDSLDLLNFINGWTGTLPVGTGSSTVHQGDCDGDRDVDSVDLLQLIDEWTGSQGSLQAIPEPLSTPLAGIMIFGALVRHRRGRRLHT